MIAYPREILDTPSADHNNSMLLQIMPYTRNIRRHLYSIRQTHTRYLPQGRVGLLWSRGIDTRTHSTFLRIAAQCRARSLFLRTLPPFMHKLMDRRHRKPFTRLRRCYFYHVYP